MLLDVKKTLLSGAQKVSEESVFPIVTIIHARISNLYACVIYRLISKLKQFLTKPLIW